MYPIWKYRVFGNNICKVLAEKVNSGKLAGVKLYKAVGTIDKYFTIYLFTSLPNKKYSLLCYDVLYKSN
jgi:hypothetical protein